MMEKVEKFKKVIYKLPHSMSRVPYTYHHDYVRTHNKKWKGASRADIAESKTWTEEELYATALTQLLLENGIDVFQFINEEDLETIQEAINITKKYVYDETC